MNRIEEEKEFETLKTIYNKTRDMTIEDLAYILDNDAYEETIYFLKDKLKWKWEDISKLIGYSVSQCKRLRNKYIELIKDEPK